MLRIRLAVFGVVFIGFSLRLEMVAGIGGVSRTKSGPGVAGAAHLVFGVHYSIAGPWSIARHATATGRS